jgi:hypothetical protein
MHALCIVILPRLLRSSALDAVLYWLFHDCRIEVAANIRKGDVGTKQLEGEAIKETSKIISENTQAQVLSSMSITWILVADRGK